MPKGYISGGIPSEAALAKIIGPEQIISLDAIKHGGIVSSVDFGNPNGSVQGEPIMISANPKHHELSEFYLKNANK